jgi:Arc/MetJ-type ribon-helix-helix transcriptional regulator
MTIELPNDLEERTQARVDAGEYPSVAAVVRAGLDALDRLEETESEAWLANARRTFRDGRAAIARGEFSKRSPQDVVARALARVSGRLKPV